MYSESENLKVKKNLVLLTSSGPTCLVSNTFKTLLVPVPLLVHVVDRADTSASHLSRGSHNLAPGFLKWGGHLETLIFE